MGGFDEDEIFLLSVDGVHCKTFEVRTDPGTKWYSHKSHGPGVTYLLGIAIKRNKLVWMDGPFPASTSDITIFRREGGLGDQIGKGKRAIGDSAFGGEPYKVAISHPGESEEVNKYKGTVKARHEVFNGRLKSFSILATEFRHNVKEHQAGFESVAVMVQYDMDTGHPLFDIHTPSED
jgi:DDE superfamily endonuclease